MKATKTVIHVAQRTSARRKIARRNLITTPFPKEKIEPLPAATQKNFSFQCDGVPQ
jgi:hypothetical protein